MSMLKFWFGSDGGTIAAAGGWGTGAGPGPLGIAWLGAGF